MKEANSYKLHTSLQSLTEREETLWNTVPHLPILAAVKYPSLIWPSIKDLTWTSRVDKGPYTWTRCVHKGPYMDQ